MNRKKMKAEEFMRKENNRYFSGQARIASTIFLIVMFCAARVNPALASDVKAKLNSNDGSTSFQVRDSQDNVVGQVDSDGNLTAVGSGTFTNTLTVSSNAIITGNVGIGTAGPSMKLQINDGVDGNIRFAKGASIYTGGTGFGMQSVNDALNSVEMLVVGGSPVVMPSGKVGIGTVGPSSLFDVVGGSITVRGSGAGLAVNGAVVVGGSSTPVTSGSSDLTVVGTSFFGTAGSYKVTNAGAATLAGSTIGDIQKNAAAAHYSVTGTAAGDAFVWHQNSSLSTARLMSLQHCNACADGTAGGELKAAAFTVTATPDIAEYIQTESDVEAFDVVSASPKETVAPGPGGETIQVAKSRKPYDDRILGVIADGSSGFRIQSHMGDIDKVHPGKPLVLAGRVPVKVTLENGPIRIGDYLTSSSKPGYAMKATEPGPAVGIALEKFDGPSGSAGKVLCFVDIGERNAGVYGDKIQQLEKKVEFLEKLIKSQASSNR